MASKDNFLARIAPGLALFSAALLGIVLANSPAEEAFFAALEHKIGPVIGPLSLHKTVLHWINDGLMAVFFLLVGLELKRELVGGRLSRPRDAMLPVFAAAGGIAVPALIYASFHLGSPETLRGWAIPAATDIAFALTVLTLAGNRVPIGLRVFLVTVAVVDDLAAIIIIAVFYSSNLSFGALGLAALMIGVLFALSRTGVRRVAPYLIVGAVMWVAVLKSGIHATLAGVITAFFIPHRTTAVTIYEPGQAPVIETTPLERVEHAIHGWVSFLILPVFGLANAALPLSGVGLDVALGPVPVAIAVALVVGKPVGIIGATWLAIRSRVGAMPEATTWRGVIGAGFAAGIGFTMSLFIGGLAFAGDAYTAGVRIGVLGGSLVSAVIALLILRTLPEPEREGVDVR